MPGPDAHRNDGLNGRHERESCLPLRVVAVDDDPTIRILLVRLFEIDRRFRLLATARNGGEAVEVVTAHGPDMVVLDVSMPQMDGIAAATRIHAACPDVLIAMCSSDRHRRDEAFRAGADLWVDKPIDFTRLSSALLAAAIEKWPSSRRA